ncbi:acetyl-CoA carboxylase, carboxyltransferase subunit beta [Olsenella phocaeensis]|uniref:acetyl-CoA carboxylase, carboxyltransferase subunit beta n=1 Tax=Olsenella phocaeensis TaxID=1852385 RepID=UPI003A91BF69
MATNRKKTKSVNVLEGAVTEVPVELPSRHVFVKCPNCRRVTDADVLADNLDVCPRCGHPMRLGARRRLAMTVDAGSFEEMDAELRVRDFLRFPGYEEKLRSARLRTGENDAVLTGVASIGGCPTGVFVMDGEFMMGSMGAVVGEKLCRLFERALELRIPVVGFTVSGGARMQEGTTSLVQMAKVSAAVRRHSEAGLLYVVVLTDPTSGGVTASFAMEGDVTLAEPGALVAFAGPRVVEQTTHKHLPAGFQRSEFLLEHGFVDRIVERRDLPSMLGRLLALHEGGAYRAPDGADVPEVRAAADVLGEPSGAAGTGKGGADASGVAPSAGGDGGGAAREGSRGQEGMPLSPDVGREGGAPAKGSPSATPAPSAYELLSRVRGGERGTVLPLMEQVFDGFLELHGDRLFGDDAAIVGGIALLGNRPVTVIGTERGRDTKERVARNFGSANPEGYRKAQRLMREAEKFGRPVVCLVDTSGAYCGVGAEERGQGEAIASSLVEMGGLRVPVVSVIVGEGGSGGALALAAGDRTLMLSGAVYSVVSPEGAASILWKDTSRAAEAAEALRVTARDLVELGIVDDVVDDAGLGGEGFVRSLSARLAEEVDALAGLGVDELLERRYDRFRRMGGDALCRE